MRTTVNKNKRPIRHIAHLRKQFKSINTYDYSLTLIKRKKNTFMRINWFFIWRNLNPFHPRMFCAKFGGNWLCGSGEEDFLISSMYFRYFVIISPCKRAGPFIWTNLNPLYPRMLCAKFGWNWPSGSGEEDENVKSLPTDGRTDGRTDRQTTDDRWSEKLTWAFSSGGLKKVKNCSLLLGEPCHFLN